MISLCQRLKKLFLQELLNFNNKGENYISPLNPFNMDIKLKEIWINPNIARELSNLIEDTELDNMGMDEYIGEFNIEIEDYIDFLNRPAEILLVCQGKLVKNGYIKQFNLYTPPEFVQKGQYINNITIKCFINGEEVAANYDEIINKIGKIIDK